MYCYLLVKTHSYRQVVTLKQVNKVTLNIDNCFNVTDDIDMDLQDIDFDEEVEEEQPAVKQQLKQESQQGPMTNIRVKEEKAL